MIGTKRPFLCAAGRTVTGVVVFGHLQRRLLWHAWLQTRGKTGARKVGDVMEEIRDSDGKLLGTIRNDAGQLVARDANYGMLGFYDPRTDQTKDPCYRVIGMGNLLATLIKRARRCGRERGSPVDKTRRNTLR